MQNLRNVHRSLIQVPPGDGPTALAWDVATDSAVCAFGPTKTNTLIELKRWRRYSRSFESIASWDAPCPLPTLDCDEVLQLHYFADSQQISLVFAGGDLVLVREEPQDGEDKIEIVGSVDAGISAAAWSPDEELLVMVTRASTLLYMTKDFENIIDVKLSPEDLSISLHVSVGWGKKETQFKGKKARALRDPTVPEHVDEGLLSELDDGRTSISWRGDGAYLAINSIVNVESLSRRTIRVFSREGVLDSVSEPVNGLESSLSWRPAGNLIAAIQRKENLLSVIFFERNGLRHGQFDLRLRREDAIAYGSVITMSWNLDSSVLAICFLDRVQLWTMSNYHYYLKQEIIYNRNRSGSEGAPPLMAWHPEKPLHLLTQSKEALQRLAYTSTVAHHVTSPPYDLGLIAVIDGTKLKLTAMRIANIPPPMAQCEIDLPTSVIDVSCAVNAVQDPYAIVAVLHHQGISIYEWPFDSLESTAPKLARTFENRSALSSVNLAPPSGQQISFLDRQSIALLERTSDQQFLKFIDITAVEDDTTAIQVPECLESIVQSISESPQELTVLVRANQFDGAGWGRIAEDVKSQSRVLVNFFETTSIRIKAIGVDNDSNIEANGHLSNGDKRPPGTRIISMAENGFLYANEQCIVKNCTSFLMTPLHLIYTTNQHLLKVVHLTSGDLDIPFDTPETDERCRSIERGAKIVSVIPSIFAVILQMPRGNLETIYPRALVLAGIRKSIDERKYKKAFMACRAHRVDMNIIYDHKPIQFLANVGLFIDQLKKLEHINLFLSQLREEDVTRTMYEETLKPRKGAEGSGREGLEKAGSHVKEHSKVNQICNAFIHELRGRNGYTQNLISAYVCQNPPNLDEGLSRIAIMKAEGSDQVDTAIEHICFLADVNKLFDNALGLYNLELALLIAQQSQKDPREYLPFLQRLQDMSELRRHFSIDDHLARYEKALDSLYRLESFEELKKYAIKHKLYRRALEHYRYREEKYAQILLVYAEFLDAEEKVKEAARAYESLLDYRSACDLYRRANLWKESLACANLTPLTKTEIQSLAQRLVSSLSESKDFSAAATIQHEHLNDTPAAIQLFCKGYHFADAIRLAALHERSDLLTSIIDPGLLEGMASTIELIADCKAQLNAQVPRIGELRRKKDEDPFSFYDGEGGGANTGAGDMDHLPDNISIAGTDASTTGGGSLFTRYTANSTGTLGTNATRRTSRHQRREERKKARGKKGSVYEEEYLVNSIKRLIEKVNTVNEEVESLVNGLLRRNMPERARAVENGMCELVHLCKDAVVRVWESPKHDLQWRTQNAVDTRIGADTGTGTISRNEEGDDLGKKNEPPVALEVPLVRDFEKSLLL